MEFISISVQFPPLYFRSLNTSQPDSSSWKKCVIWSLQILATIYKKSERLLLIFAMHHVQNTQAWQAKVFAKHRHSYNRHNWYCQLQFLDIFIFVVNRSGVKPVSSYKYFWTIASKVWIYYIGHVLRAATMYATKYSILVVVTVVL